MLVLGVWALADQGSFGLRYWIAVITLPPLIISLAAAWQYRFGKHSGAGAAAAVITWAFCAVYLFTAGTLFFFSALLLTVAWWRGRPRDEVLTAAPTVIASHE
jgi:fatty acid desaturase